MSRTGRWAVALGACVAVLANAAHAPARSAHVATFRSFAHPSDAYGAGEPSIGVNRETGAALYQSGLNTYTVTGLDSGDPQWRTSNAILTSKTSFDPTLATDFETGRTFVSQLTLACSLMAYTDTDGRAWQEVPDGCGVGSLFDHQSVGTGAFVAGGTLRPTTAYPRAVYYCAQAIAATNCATSLDGGLTFLPAVTAWTDGCSASHGRIASAPDGTVFVPPHQCDRGVDVVVSEDNGLTWDVRPVPGSLLGLATGDSSIAAGADGTAYLSWGQLDGDDTTPYVAVTRDRGHTWSTPRPVAVGHRIRNMKFVSVVAGDGDRAAVAFLGTETGGDDQDVAFTGVWRLYVSFTYDRGASWQTVVATPESPVQVGKICIAGIYCDDEYDTRNLLDFIGATVDVHGRVLVAFADGCLEEMCDAKARRAAATIARQQSGRTLYRAYD